MERKQRIWTIITGFVALVCLSLGIACSKKEEPVYTLNQTSVSLAVDETVELTLSPSAENVSWTTSNEKVAMVDDGTVTATGYGEACVRATVGEIVLECAVSVPLNEATGVAFSLQTATNENTLRIFKGETYPITPKLCVGDKEVALTDGQISVVSDENVVKATVENARIVLTGVNVGNSEVYVSCTYEGKTLYTEIYTVYVDVDKVLYFQSQEVSLLTPKTLQNTDVSSSTQQPVQAYMKSTILNESGVEVNAEEIEWRSENEQVAVVENGMISAVSMGNTIIKAITEYGEASLPVCVSYPISSASDLDFLAMVTYTKDKATAESYLNGNYIFTNDIDYSAHTRNYILPIASVNHEHGCTTQNGEDYWNLDRKNTGEFALGGVTRGTYYSIGWKDVLGLTEDSKDVNGTTALYMKNSALAGYAENAAGTEFRGINPNGLAFGGRIDGNGYAIKNAFYMADNLQGQARNGSEQLYRSTGYNGVGGFFVGYNTGIIENLELQVSVADVQTYYYNGGNYSIEKSGESKTLKAMYNDASGNKQIVMLNSKGGIHTALTGSYNPHKGGAGIGATGIVAVNNGVLQNLYHKVNVYASLAEVGLSAQGVIASINGYKITNCVVDKFENCYEAGETTIASVTLDEKAGNSGQTLVRYAFVGEIKGSEITGCYSLLKRDCTNNSHVKAPKAVTFTKEQYDGKISGGEIDELSNTVFTTFNDTADYNANYVDMYQAYQTNNNLHANVWEITANAASIGLKNNMKGLQVGV